MFEIKMIKKLLKPSPRGGIFLVHTDIDYLCHTETTEITEIFKPHTDGTDYTDINSRCE